MLGFSGPRLIEGHSLEQAFRNSLLFADLPYVRGRGGKPFASLCEGCSVPGVAGVDKRSSVGPRPLFSSHLRGRESVKLIPFPSKVKAEFHKVYPVGQKGPGSDKRYSMRKRLPL